MRRSMLCVMLIALLATTAGAYDRLYTRDFAATHDQGSFGVAGALIYLSASEWWDADGEKFDFADNGKCTKMWIPIDIWYSVMDQFEIGVQPMFVMDKETADGMDDMEGTGIGDTWIWGKYNFMPEPMLSARAGFKVATGDDEPDAGDLGTGTGQMDVDGALLFGIPAGPGMFDAAVGYRMRMEHSDSKIKPGDEFHFMAGYTYLVNEMMNLGLYADGYFGSDAEWDGTTVTDSGSNIVYVNPNFTYMMDSGMTLGADFHYPISGTLTEAAWGFDVFLGWGM